MLHVLLYCSLLHSSETGSQKPGSRLVIKLSSPLSTPSTCPAFYVGAGDLNTDHHACRCWLVFGSLIQTEIPGKRDLRLRNCLPQIGLWTCGTLLIDGGGSPSPLGGVILRPVVLDCIRKVAEQVGEGKPVSTNSPCSPLQFLLWLSDGGL